MTTVVITGGTDGIGRALAAELLDGGATVVVVGRNPAKGREFLAAADKAGAAGRVRFVTADLSLLAETERAVAEIRAEFPALDALVLCARHYRSRRTVTAEGLEENFALFYLSRRLFGEGLADALAAAAAPVVVNVAGPGAPLDIVRWDDLELRHGYHGGAALGQGGKLNDLLGVAFAERHGWRGIRYVLVHPGVTATSFSGEYDQATLPHIRSMQASAKPATAALPPILSVIERPPAVALSAFVEGRGLDVSGPDFDPDAARRLETLTERLLAVRRGVRPR